MIGYEMMNAIRRIHIKDYIHRDIKPDNFMFGKHPKEKRLYIIDMGLSKKYIQDGKHIDMKTGKSLVGTARYASINSHKGYEQSRRDDLESIGYVLVYLIKGILPWQGINLKPGDDHFTKIMEKKISTSIEELCEGLPKQFLEYFKYTKNLQYTEPPDYIYLKDLFLAVLKTKYNLEQPDFEYEWLDEAFVKNISTSKSPTNSNIMNSMLMNKSAAKSGNRENMKDHEIDLNDNIIYNLDEASFG